MSTEQPEALRLIEQLPDTAMYSGKSAKWSLEAIAELRRLHLLNSELLEALEEVVRISDRDHEAWDKAKAAIAKARGE